MPNGRLVWTESAVAARNREKVLELHESGLSLREIANELKIGKSSVERYINDNTERKSKDKRSEKPKKKSR